MEAAGYRWTVNDRTATEPAARPQRPTLRTRVVSTRRLAPSMIRVVLTGEDLRGLPIGAHTDHYVKLLFDAPSATDPAPRRTTRAYTVRAWDPDRLEVTIDFVVHGDRGLAGPWAASAQPGDEIDLMGPGGDYSPDPQADWHLFVGDEAALPAIGASLARVRPGVPAYVVVEVDGPADELELDSPGTVHLTWVHRDSADAGVLTEALTDAVRALDFPPGQVHAFVHGEATAMRSLRRHLLVERGVPRDALSLSGYWKRGLLDEQWRAGKAEWKAQVEADLG